MAVPIMWCQLEGSAHVPITWGQLERSAAAVSPSQSEAINDPKYWRYRAEEARAMAESMTKPEAKQLMLNVVADYEKLAKRAEERSEGVPRSLFKGDEIRPSADKKSVNS
jgi:hypothetical protein